MHAWLIVATTIRSELAITEELTISPTALDFHAHPILRLSAAERVTKLHGKAKSSVAQRA